MTTKRNIVSEVGAEHIVPLSLRVSRRQHERLKAMAAAEQRSVSQIMRFAIQDRIDAYDAREAAA